MFRQMTYCSLVTMWTVVCFKYLTEIALKCLGASYLGQINLIFLLDLLEVLITSYCLYSLHVFCLCLEKGLIKEYRCLNKFYWLAFCTFAVVVQKEVVFLAVDFAENQYFQGVESMASRANCLLVSGELLLASYAFHKHFGIVASDEYTKY